DPVVEVGAVHGRRPSRGERVERIGSIELVWHRGLLDARRAGPNIGRNGRSAAASYTGDLAPNVSSTRACRLPTGCAAGPQGGFRAPIGRAYTRRVKLVVAIVHHEDAGDLVDALLDREFRATRLASSGGFLKQSNVTVIL